jgi:hypothetical protein
MVVHGESGRTAILGHFGDTTQSLAHAAFVTIGAILTQYARCR